jgi:hypothetical protein
MARQTNYGCRNGTSRAALLRSILEDYGHVVEVNSHTARQMLTNSIRRGIELGRLRTGLSTVQRNNLQFLYFYINFPNSTSSEELLTGYWHLAVPSVVDPHLLTYGSGSAFFAPMADKWPTRNNFFCSLPTTFLKVHLLQFHGEKSHNGSHKKINVFLTFLLVDGRIRIQT